MKIDLPDLPPGVWFRILWLAYRLKWMIHPLRRFFGSEAKMTWGELDFATKVLLPALSAYNPELVVGIGVGGAIFGAMIAGNLNDKSFITIDRVVTWAKNLRESKLVDAHGGAARESLLRGKRVLLVHGEIVTGQTTREALDYLRRFEPEEIKIVCTDYLPSSSVRPDYSYLQASGVIQKPWRVTKTYRNPDEGVHPS